jgi:hypothetical protein
MNDTLIASGQFKVDVFEGEKLKYSVIENNLVVTLGKTNLTKLLGGDAAGKKVEKISVGTNNTGTLVGDTAITGAFTKALLSVSYPSAQSVQFNFEIENGEANGMTIREFGLLNTDNVLFARKVRGTDIVKTSAIRLVGSWTITIN